MIHDKDRAHWFGASDARYIFGKETNKSWQNWWNIKCGLCEDTFQGNIYTKAGNTWEHSILNSVGAKTWDRQILIPRYRLRVNLDGNDYDTIYEVKTYQIHKGFEITDGYYNQCQIQMFAWNEERFNLFTEKQPTLKKKNPYIGKMYLVSYGLYPDEYYGEYSKEDIENGLLKVDTKRLKVDIINYHGGHKIRRKLRKLSQRLVLEEIR